MTEYWLQKKTIGGWSHVTWYSDLTQATENFNRCSAGNSGYSWRVVKAETVVEKLLEEVTDIITDAEILDVAVNMHRETLKPKSGWATPPIERGPATGWESVDDVPVQSQDQKSGWGATPTAGWGETVKIISPSPNAGVSVGDGRGAKPGSVCLMHHNLKKRMRAMPEELDGLLSQGWERGGPRTQFRE